MAPFWSRVWTNHKGTESHAFTAGQDLQKYQYIKETSPNSYIAIPALTVDEAIGYVISTERGVKAGEKVEIMLGEWIKPLTPGGGNANIHVDTVCPTPTDDSSLGYVVGSQWFNMNRQSLYTCVDDTVGAAIWMPETHFHLDSVAPTVTDDEAACYFVGFYWYDTVTGIFYLCIDQTPGAAVWVPIQGITDVLIGRTLHVASNGNDGTAIPNSLVNKYLTVAAAFAASGPLDTIYIWPGAYTLAATMDIDGTKASKFYMHPGAVCITPPIGTPAFSISPAVKLNLLGHGSWLCRSYIWVPASPADGICRLEFEAEICAQLGVQGFIGNYSSMEGTAKVFHATDLAFECTGWCDFNIQIDINEFTGAAQYIVGNISDNNGLSFNASEGCSRLQVGGRTGKYTQIMGAYGPGFTTGIFTTGIGGGRDDRHVKICADVYVFDGAAFNIHEGTWVWEGSGYADKDPLPTNDLFPYFLFDDDTNNDFYFEHRMGSVNSVLDNTILQFNSNGVVKLSGNYVTQGDTYPLIKYDQPPVQSRLILSGNYKTLGPIHVMEFNDLALGTPFLPVFGEATVDCPDGSVFIESTSGNPMSIYVEHSLVTRTNYNAGVFTDMSVGNRHYVDRQFTNYIPSEHLR